MTDTSPQQQLSELFGSYRAEWLREQIFDLYTSPVYFPELTTNRSCMLVGGRGSGKTTALRALSWEGQAHLTDAPLEEWPYFGIYYRVDTNRVTAFRGPELDASTWGSLFAHYFNSLVVERILEFISWFEVTSGWTVLPSDACRRVGLTLGLEAQSTIDMLSASLRESRIRFEAYINNIVDAQRPFISLQSALIAQVLEEMAQCDPLRDRNFFIIIDEYENLLDEQQRVVNTMIKHAAGPLSFKIGVRELGLRQRTTLNEHEQLRSPADYVRIDISQKLDSVFTDFAVRICDDRISRMTVESSGPSLRSVRELLPALSEDVEAELLGVQQHVSLIRGQLVGIGLDADLERFDSAPPLLQYLIGFWSQGQGEPLAVTYRDFLDRPQEWDTRYKNYKHALLYTLRRKRRGIQKYYAGWDTFGQVAGNNIRFYLQLVEQTLLRHLSTGGTLSSPVRPEVQTAAAQTVGRINLSELEGLSV